MSRNPTNNCQFEACPDPCTLVHCGDHGSCNKDSPTFSNDQPCTCTDGYTGVSCQDAPTPRQHANLLYQSVLLVLTGINRAIRCDSGKCSYSDDVGKSWRTLGNTHSVLAGSPDGSVLWGVDADGFILKSTDSGLFWEKSYAAEQEWFNTAQYDVSSTDHSQTSFPDFVSSDYEPQLNEVITAADGSQWYANTHGVNSYPPEHNLKYFTSWSTTAAPERSDAAPCDWNCLGVDCQPSGYCLDGQCHPLGQ
jgi:hypothetical protein